MQESIHARCDPFCFASFSVPALFGLDLHLACVRDGWTVMLELVDCFPPHGVKVTRRYREAKRALAQKAARLAKQQRQLTTRERLAQAITEYIDWNAFAYWVRLNVEIEGHVSAEVRQLLDERCPGFLDQSPGYESPQLRQPAFLWRNLLSWLHDNRFGFVQAEGWLHALLYDSAADPRMKQVTNYWLECDQEWRQRRPAVLPSFAQWQQAAVANFPSEPR